MTNDEHMSREVTVLTARTPRTRHRDGLLEQLYGLPIGIIHRMEVRTIPKTSQALVPVS